MKAETIKRIAESMPDASMGYLTDLGSLTFSDTEEMEPKWVQLLPKGKYLHPTHGELDVTDDVVTQMAENVEKGVRGQQLDIDYEHKEGPRGGRAAGWLVRAEARDDGLWGLVSWTKRALEEIKAGEWRYFSPEFNWKWTDHKGNTFSNVLFGGALTNRPFLKNILPVNLSEIDVENEDKLLSDDQTGKEGENEEVYGLKFMEQLRQKLGLSEGATEEQILARADEVSLAATKKLEEDSKAKKFAEEFPEQAALLTEMQEQRTADAMKFAELETDKKLSEWTTPGSVKNEKGEAVSRVLPPVVLDEVKEARLSLSTDQRSKFDSVLEKLLAAGLAELGEHGSAAVGENKGGEEGDTAPAQAFLSEVKKEQSEAKKEGDNISLSEATKRAARKNPELAEQWRKSSQKSA